MIRKALTVLLLSSIVPCTVALAAEPLFSTYLEAGTKALKANNNPEALRMLELAAKNAEHLKPDDKAVVDLYESLGNALANAGDMKRAEEYLQKSLKLREAAEPKDEVMIFKSLMFLGTLYRDQNRFAEAEALYQRAMKAYDKPGPMGVLFQATSLTALGSLYTQMSRPVEAEVLLRKAIELRAETADTELPSDTAYDALAKALDAQGKYTEALGLYQKALAIAERTSGPDTIAISQVNLASALSNLGKNSEARELINTAIKTVEKNRGLKSPLAATCYSNLATVAIYEDQYAEAESLLNKALSIHEQLLGPDSSSVAYDLIKLMEVYRNQGQYTKAQETGERAVNIFKKKLGSDSIATAKAMSNLADIYNSQMRFDDAHKLAQEIIRVTGEKLGPDSVDYAIGLLLAAEVDNAKHKNADAISNMQKAEDVLSANKNSEPGLIARVDEELSEFLQTDKKYSEAETKLKKCIEIREKLWGTESPRLIPNLNALVEIYKSLDKESQAQEVRERIAKIRHVTPGLPRSLFERSTEPAPQSSPIAEQQPISEKWLLAVGISNFANPALNLKFAAKDAVDFSNFLVHDENFSPDHVKVITDKLATRENIIDALGKGWLGKRAKANDLVVVFISSHGSMARDDAGGANFLVAHDTDENALISTGIPMQWLSQIVKEQVHSDKVVLIMDVCHSGAVSGDTANKANKSNAQIASADLAGAKGVPGQKGLKRSLPQMNAEKNIEAGSGQAIICSSSSDQNSWESKKYPNSVFTRQLIESMQKEGPNANLDALFSAMRKNVENEVLQDRGAVQTPVFYNSKWNGPSPVLSIKSQAQTLPADSRKASQ